VDVFCSASDRVRLDGYTCWCVGSSPAEKECSERLCSRLEFCCEAMVVSQLNNSGTIASSYLLCCDVLLAQKLAIILPIIPIASWHHGIMASLQEERN
jgi:hypothetical protein